MVGWSIRPVLEDVVAEGLKIKLEILYRAKDSVPVCLIQDNDCTASAAHTLITCYFDGIDQDRGMEASSVVTWYGGDLVAKACKKYCVRPAGRCLGMYSAL